MKKILVDINHPAHVHLFRNFIFEMKKKGNEVIVLAKDVKSITSLLELYNLQFITTGPKKDSLLLKYIYEFVHLIKLYRIVLTKKIDYGIGVSMVLPLVSKLTSMKSFALDDDDFAVTPIAGKFIAHADVILNPSALNHENRGEQRICHPSYHELAYLHPNQFKADLTLLAEMGIKQGETYFILRFNAFKAHHDADAVGFSLKQKLALINLLNPYGKIFITTERAMEPELEAYRLPISAEKIHTLMYYATLFIGDSQTMVSEAALLGTPAIKLNSFAGRLSIPNEIEHRYGLCYSFQPQDFDRMVDKVRELLSKADLKGQWRYRKEKLLQDKVDLTSFLVWFVSTYPTSFDRLKKNPIYPFADQRVHY